MKKIFIICLLFCCIISSAQDSSGKKSNQIYFKSFSGWRMDGNKLSPKQFKTEIYKVPTAIPFYQKAKKNQTIFYGCVIPMGVFTFLHFQQNNNMVYSKKHPGFLIGGLISGGIGLHCLARSQKQFFKAVGLHNENQPLIY